MTQAEQRFVATDLQLIPPGAKTAIDAVCKGSGKGSKGGICSNCGGTGVLRVPSLHAVPLAKSRGDALERIKELYRLGIVHWPEEEA